MLVPHIVFRFEVRLGAMPTEWWTGVLNVDIKTPMGFFLESAARLEVICAMLQM